MTGGAAQLNKCYETICCTRCQDSKFSRRPTAFPITMVGALYGLVQPARNRGRLVQPAHKNRTLAGKHSWQRRREKSATANNYPARDKFGLFTGADSADDLHHYTYAGPQIMPLWPEETMPPPCGAHRARAQSDECMQLLSKCPQVDSGATSFWCKSASTRMQHAGQGNRSTLILDCGSATLLVNIGKIEEHPGSRPCGVNEATSNAAGTAL